MSKPLPLHLSLPILSFNDKVQLLPDDLRAACHKRHIILEGPIVTAILNKLDGADTAATILDEHVRNAIKAKEAVPLYTFGLLLYLDGTGSPWHQTIRDSNKAAYGKCIEYVQFWRCALFVPDAGIAATLAASSAANRIQGRRVRL